MKSAKVKFFIPHRLRGCALFLLILILQACTSISHRNSTEPVPKTDPNIILKQVSVTGDDLGWWYVGFHRNIEEDETPAWYLDTLIAYRVMKPVLDTYDEQIGLWRFHRRAAVDAAGHKFSLIFYSTRKDAELIYQTFNKNTYVASLQRENYIDRVSYTDINGTAQSKIEATSDKNWPLELQKSWPEFAMGVSKTWLQLVEQYVENADIADEQEIEAQVEQFKQVSEQIDSLWEQKGGHAFLHHLNALFGYQELYIIERRLTRF